MTQPTIQQAGLVRGLGRTVLRVAFRIVATALAAGLLSATLVRFSPGFGLGEEQFDMRLSRESLQAMHHSHDAERNPVRFYATYLKRVVTGDLGFSQSLGRPIRELLAERAATTAVLTFCGIAGAWVIALILAVPPVTWRLPKLAGLCTVFSGISASIPAAGMAILLFRFGGSARWMIAAILFPKLYLYLQGLLRQSYGMPHVLLARAKGLGSFQILMRHVLPPALAPLAALAAVSINLAFGAAIAVEAICDLPGLGQLAWKAALARDLPVLVALTVIVTLVTQISSLVADVCSPALRSNT